MGDIVVPLSWNRSTNVDAFDAFYGVGRSAVRKLDHLR